MENVIVRMAEWDEWLLAMKMDVDCSCIEDRGVRTDRLQTSLNLQRLICRVRYFTLPQVVSPSMCVLLGRCVRLRLPMQLSSTEGALGYRS